MLSAHHAPLVLSYSPDMIFNFQPPPQIYDAQLEEREHAIEEWKGKTTRFDLYLCHSHSPIELNCHYFLIPDSWKGP